MTFSNIIANDIRRRNSIGYEGCSMKGLICSRSRQTNNSVRVGNEKMNLRHCRDANFQWSLNRAFDHVHFTSAISDNSSIHLSYAPTEKMSGTLAHVHGS